MSTARKLIGRVLALSLAPAVLLAVPTVADSSFVQEVSASSPDPLSLGPGISTERTVRVQNKYDADAALHLEAANVVNRENDCIEPEQRVEGTTCVDDDIGELGDWLQVTVHKAAPGPAESMVVWSGMLADLEDGVDLMARVPAGGEPKLRIVTTMVAEADNRTMTDRVTYDLRWTLESTAGTQTTALRMDSSRGSVGTPEVLSTSARVLERVPAGVGIMGLASSALLVTALGCRRRGSWTPRIPH